MQETPSREPDAPPGHSGRVEGDARPLALLDTVPALMSYVTPDGRYALVNKAYEGALGRPRETIVGRTVQDVLGVDAWQRVAPLHARALRGEAVEFELEAGFFAAGPRWIHVVFTPHRDAQGNVAGVVVLSNDVSARRHAEERQRLLGRIAEATQSLTDPMEMTQATARLLADHLDVDRCAYAQVLDESVFLISGDYCRGVPSIVGSWPVADFGEACVRAMLDNEPFVVEDTEADPRIGEREKPAYAATSIRAVICVPLHKERRFTAAMAVHRKVPRAWTPDEIELVRTVVQRCWESLERARVVRSLEASEARVRLILESMPQKTFTADLRGNADYFNPQWTAYTGLPPSRLLEVGRAAFVHPDDAARDEAAWRRSIETGTPYELEHRLRRHDGEYRWHITRSVPLEIGAERLSMWVGSSTDIDQMKRAQDELTRLNQALLATDQHKDRFLATLAHELRNPLAPIRNGVALLKATVPQSAGAGVVGMMERQITHLVRLVDDLLDVARINSGKVRLHKEDVDLRDVVRQSVEASQTLFEGPSLQLRVVLPPSPVPLHADATRLVQALTNLLNNAAMHSRSGGEVVLQAEAQDGQAQVRVRDAGDGIDPQVLPRIFDAFSQAGGGGGAPGSGLGLGLSVARSLVHLHGGEIEAHSEGLGRGSEFVLRLPLGRASGSDAASAPSPAAEPARADVPKLRILVVDDNVDAADSLAELLGLSGHEARSAHGGVEALAMARQVPPDVAFIDLGMPVMDGVELAQAFAADPSLQRAVRVALTGWGAETDRRRTAEAGFAFHITKPAQDADLQRILDSVRAQARDRRLPDA